MFTGIIEELGTVLSVDLLKDAARLAIGADIVLNGSQIGDSIAVNGVCLTATALTPRSFTVDMMYETLQKTSLRELKQHSRVNLERALQLQSRLGGHLVSGHVDGIGNLASITTVGIAQVYKIRTSPDITAGLLPKGSVAIDGISLTVIDVNENDFTVSLIPHTMKNTTLGFKGIGSVVNLETDIIGKYVSRILNKNSRLGENKKDISLEFLTNNGFI